jgi:hypothetical protein
MDLQDLKRWHWMLIGLIVGGLWAASRLFYGPEVEDGELFSFTEHAILARKDAACPAGPDTGSVWLTNVVVHPPMRDPSPTAGAAAPSAKVQFVTGTLRGNHVVLKGGFKLVPFERPFKFRASVPYAPRLAQDDFVARDRIVVGDGPLGLYTYVFPKPVAGYVKPAAGQSYATINAYFDELNRKYGAGTVTYRYNWWESPLAIITLYPLAGLVVIGGIWPSMIGLLYGMGLGGRRKENAEDPDLAHYKSTSRATMPQQGREMSAADERRLAMMTAELERNLQPTGAKAADPPAVPAPAAAVRELGGSAEATEAKPTEKLAPAKAFGADTSDYYPTEVHKATDKDKQKS